MTANEDAYKNKTLRYCGALSETGQECSNLTQQPIHKLCPHHSLEYKSLYKQYKISEGRYRRISRSSDGGLAVDQRTEKIKWGQQTLILKNRLDRQFLGEYAKNKGQAKRTLKLEAEINALERSIAQGADFRDPFPTSEATGLSDADRSDYSIYNSLISPHMPMSALDHLPPDHPVKMMKREMTTTVDGLVTKLYSVAPSLNDSGTKIFERETKSLRDTNDGDHVLRFVFREFLVWKDDADMLALAKEKTSIDSFLRSCSPSDVSEYIEFFKKFGREDTLHFLRDAVCDYFSFPTDASIIVLGERIATDDEVRCMTVESWDILYQRFSSIVNWWNIEQFCYRSEDMALIKTLIALDRYSPTKGGEGGWLDKHTDVSQECPLAALQGFFGVYKGNSNSSFSRITTNDEGSIERQSRCYLVGRMTKNEPHAEKLIHELMTRIDRYIAVIYDRESNRVISKSPEINESLWLNRKRSARVGQDLQDAFWYIESSFKDILSDLNLIRNFRDKNMVGNYYEFIIIDRNPGSDCSILDNVAVALMQLTGESPIQQMLDRAAQLSIPADQQSEWLEDRSIELSPAAALNVPNVNYEGNRVRAWNVLDQAPKFIRGLGKGTQSRSDILMTAKILANMESHGLVTMLKEFRPTQACSYVSPGTDGIEDIYFDYSTAPLDNSLLRQGCLESPDATPSPDSLLKFARTFKAANPDAVFAKGRLHVNYCAWPMPSDGFNIPNFRTAEGHIFHWNVVPFDIPMSSHLWQYHVHKGLNSRLPFVHFVLTTFVVCAKNPQSVEVNLALLLAAANRHGWKLSVPSPSLWTADIESLDLQKLWVGVEPASYKPRGSVAKAPIDAEPELERGGWSCVVQ